MIEQTIPLEQLTAGMARCVREWILPHLTDPMARIEAEQLATLLEGLPRVESPAAAEMIRADSADARDLLARLAKGGGAVDAGGATVNQLMRENAALKVQLEALADELRRSPDAGARQRLAEVQRFFVRSMAREVTASAEGADFATLTSRDRAAKQE